MKPNPARMVGLPDECRFFIDDSNIWIEIQKFAAKGNTHMPKLTDSDQDPHLRIDIGRLATTLLKVSGRSNKTRVQSTFFYYGSKPPPSDSVWEAMDKNNFETKIYDRAASGRGLMGVDISGIASDLSARADMEAQYRIDSYEHRNRIDRTTFICITGDREMMPAILKALQSGICVELWAWKHGIAEDFVKLEATGGPTASLFSVHYLDGVFSEIFFTNYFSTRRGGKSVDPAKAVVLCDFMSTWYERYIVTGAAPNEANDSGAYRKELAHKGPNPLEKAVCDKLMLLGKVFYITRDVPTAASSTTAAPPTLFIEFPRVPDHRMEMLLLKVRNAFHGIATVLSWPVYAGKTSRKTIPTTETSNMYAPLGGDDTHVQETDTMEEAGEVEEVEKVEEVEEAKEAKVEVEIAKDKVEANMDPEGVSASSGWQTVTHFNRAEAHRRNRNRTRPCRYGVRCYKRGQCGFGHTDMERNLLQKFPLLTFKKWKTEPCRYGDSCANGRQCTYAHSASEAWCMKCHSMGHYASGCKP